MFNKNKLLRNTGPSTKMDWYDSGRGQDDFLMTVKPNGSLTIVSRMNMHESKFLDTGGLLLKVTIRGGVWEKRDHRFHSP